MMAVPRRSLGAIHGGAVGHDRLDAYGRIDKSHEAASSSDSFLPPLVGHGNHAPLTGSEGFLKVGWEQIGGPSEVLRASDAP